MLEIAPGLIYLTREDWQADPRFPRLGGADDPRNPGYWTFVDRLRRRYVIIHHTVGVDLDATPLIWETLGEVKSEARKLQIIRNDLGDDWPYSFGCFPMVGGILVIVEGRGEIRWGAHVAGTDEAGDYYNEVGLGFGWHGNYSDYRFDPRPYLPQFNLFLGWLVKRGMTNLGERRARVGGRVASGHRELRNAATRCPGQYMMPYLGEIKVTMPPRKETPMELIAEYGSPYIFVRDGVFFSYLRTWEEADALDIPRVVRRVPVRTLLGSSPRTLVRADTLGLRRA